MQDLRGIFYYIFSTDDLGISKRHTLFPQLLAEISSPDELLISGRLYDTLIAWKGGIKLIALTSVKDLKIRLARELNLPKVRRETSKVVLYGEDGLIWANSFRCKPQYILCTRPLHDYLIPFADGIDCFIISDGLSKKVSGTSQVIPYITVAEMEDVSLNISEPTVILDDIKDHGNIGTIIRTAAAFGFKNIIMTNTQNDIYYKNIINASRGTALYVNYENIPAESVMGFLKSAGYIILSTSPHGNCSLGSAAHTYAGKKLAVIFGNETNGVSEALIKSSDAAVKINIDKSVESLNVGVAAGIILSALNRI